MSTGTYRIQLFTKLFLYLFLSGQIFTTWIRIRITTCGFIYNCFEQPQQIQQLCTFTVGKLDYPKCYALPTETHHPSSCFRSGWQDISRSTRACSNHSRLVQISFTMCAFKVPVTNRYVKSDYRKKEKNWQVNAVHIYSVPGFRLNLSNPDPTNKSRSGHAT